ncbi:hypothetical protein J6590_052147 [Homalodisca vitripennis]|nr:hypothetical protein J6590_052147 [Homalodisca vitripennis]
MDLLSLQSSLTFTADNFYTLQDLMRTPVLKKQYQLQEIHNLCDADSRHYHASSLSDVLVELYASASPSLSVNRVLTALLIVQTRVMLTVDNTTPPHSPMFWWRVTDCPRLHRSCTRVQVLACP